MRLRVLVLCVVIAGVIVADIASEIWSDLPMVASLLASAITIALTVLVVDNVLRRREAARTGTVARRHAALLLRTSQRVVGDVRARAVGMGDEDRQAASAAADPKVRALAQLVEEAVDGVAPLIPMGGGVMRVVGKQLRQRRAMLARERELVSLVEPLEQTIVAMTAFLAVRDDGRNCLDVADDLIDYLHGTIRAARSEPEDLVASLDAPPTADKIKALHKVCKKVGTG